jgi:LemA protein
MAIFEGILAAMLVIVLGLIVYGTMIYNGLVGLKNNIDKAWSNIDVLLKQRFDELPKLVKVCEGYMKHERNTLEAVIKARAMLAGAKTEAEIMGAQNAVTGALKSLFALVEKYPDLKADVSFRQLQSRISELEDQIADRREFYNDSVNTYNIRIAQVPDVFIAKQMNFTARKLWEIDPQDRKDVKIEFGA